MIALFFSVMAIANPLDGLWVQDCANGYQRQENFQANRAEYTEMNFWDKNCTKFSLETVSRGEFSLGAEVNGVRQIDFEFFSVSMKPRDAATAEHYNARRICGIRDWKENVETDVTGRECDFFGLGSVLKVPSRGDRKFGIVKEGLDSLFFGRLDPTNDGSSSRKRPSELDSKPYRRIYFP